uniref:DUF4220 domain-containing protein n=1 Tax=Aegilops tauschii TaxID=37682 RepID=M8B8T4_AEGTA
MTVPVSLLVSSGLCVGVSACVPTGLAFHASFALSLVYLVRVLSPELVDGFFGLVDAVVQEDLRNARAFFRDDPLIAPIYACAEEQARRAHAPGRGAGNAAGGAITEKDMRDAWECLWFVIIMMHCIDACFLGLMLGKRPFVLASLAIYNVAALASARKAYLTTDEGEDADGAHVNVNKWHNAAMTVLAIDVAKVVATYVVLDFYLGALLFVSLGAKAVFLLDRAIYLSDEGASGDDDSNLEGAGLAGEVAGETEGSDDDTQEVADLAGDVAGDAEGSDDIGAENSSDIAVSEHEEEEDSATEKHSDVSDSEEQRRAESDYSSSSVDDWTFVGADPMMPTNVNGGANRRFGFLP